MAKILSRTIKYTKAKPDAGKLAKSISQARKSGATKKYKDSVKAGYSLLGKKRTKPSKVLRNTPKYKLPKKPSTGKGVGM